MSDTKTVVFVGLGRMGLPMAIHIHECSEANSGSKFDVVGVDLDDERTAAFRRSGGRTAPLAEAATGADIAVTMLRTPDQVAAATDGLLDALPEGALLIDMSTTGPDTAQTLAERATDYNIRMLSAPVSGGVSGAKDETLTVMVGGAPADVEQAQSVFECFSNSIFHVGDIGTGQTAKLCNQLLVGAELLSISESFRLGEAAGIDPTQLYEILTNCIGTSGILEKKGQRLVEGDFEPGADVNLQHKDSQLILDLAASTNVPVFLAATVAQAFVHARQAGFGSQDHFALYRLLDEVTEGD